MVWDLEFPDGDHMVKVCCGFLGNKFPPLKCLQVQRSPTSQVPYISVSWFKEVEIYVFLILLVVQMIGK